MSTQLTYIGPSWDRRTNRWTVTCPRCEHDFEPRTTMFAQQVLVCEGKNCGAEIFVDYNEGTASLVKSATDNLNEEN